MTCNKCCGWHVGRGGADRPSKEAKTAEATAPENLITKVMSKEGPTCTVVVLRAGPEKKKEEMVVDFSPKKRVVEEVLGGRITFVGQWERISVVIVQRADQEDLVASGAPLNEHKLQPPFHEEVLRGDLLLMRTDDEGEPENFTLQVRLRHIGRYGWSAGDPLLIAPSRFLQEYNDWEALEIQPDEEDEEDEEEEDEEEEEDDDDDDDDAGDEEGYDEEQALL